MEEGFVWRRRVCFGDCDPAGIAYTGRIPDFALEAIEAFWESLLDGETWFHFVVDHGIGTPFVHMRFDFSAPIAPRSPLLCRVTPTVLGTTSMRFEVRGGQEDALCFVAEFVCVFVSAADMRKIKVPERIRAALLAAYPALTRP